MRTLSMWRSLSGRFLCIQDQPLLSGLIGVEFPFLEFDAEHIVNISAEESLLIQQAFKDILTEYARFSPEKDFVLRNYILILLHRIREIYQRSVKKTNQNIIDLRKSFE